jgi:AcrR family transcriptional regulator
MDVLNEPITFRNTITRYNLRQHEQINSKSPIELDGFSPSPRIPTVRYRKKERGEIRSTTSENSPGIEPARPESGEMARQIASTAARLFAEKGYDATSVREIVEAAGVTKPTLYYHFRSKEGLAQALLTNPLRALEERMNRIAQEIDDPVEALGQILETQYEFCREDPDRARFIFGLIFGPAVSGLANEMIPYKRGSHDCMAGLTERLVNAGILARSSLDAFLLACKGVLVASALDYLYHDRELEPGLPGRLVGDLLRGFGIRDRTESGS